jgi:branched-chain amino acid transport system ATP-binding protein
LLKIENIQSFYGHSKILFDVSLLVKHGQVVSLLGRNGMGKTTTVKSIMGLVNVNSGDIRFDNTSLPGKPPFDISRLGIGYVPEGRRIFPNLNVAENLLATARNTRDPQYQAGEPWTLERVLDFFPALKPRLKQMGATLSGGEQQMLAIGRALLLNPKLLILDEATEGLAPLVRRQIWGRLADLKQSGLSILIIDKHINKLKILANYHYIIEKGHIVWSGNSEALDADEQVTQKYIGVQ